MALTQQFDQKSGRKYLDMTLKFDQESVIAGEIFKEIAVIRIEEEEAVMVLRNLIIDLVHKIK